MTFDQPFYQKAVEIVHTCNDDEVKEIHVGLGGFHTLMSYLGCIVYILAGSGLKEALRVCYAINSVEKMLDGKAYSRAMRGHTLIFSALCQKVLSEIDFSNEEQMLMRYYITRIKNNDLFYQEIENYALLREVNKQFFAKIDEIKSRGKTAKLWIEYIEMVAIAKSFILSLIHI